MIEVRNKYEVNKQQRKQWSPCAQNHFNYLIEIGNWMKKNHSFHHELDIPAEHFLSIIWNMAFMSAGAIDNHLLDIEIMDGKK